MLKIIKIEKNPKRKFRKKKMAVKCKHRGLTKTEKKSLHKKVKSLTKIEKKILARKNPPPRKRHETMIVGYSAYHDWDRPKSKRYYFNGEGFSRKRSEAKIFSGDGAKIEAKRMLPYLPQGIYAIRVETL